MPLPVIHSYVGTHVVDFISSQDLEKKFCWTFYEELEKFLKTS